MEKRKYREYYRQAYIRAIAILTLSGAALALYVSSPLVCGAASVGLQA